MENALPSGSPLRRCERAEEAVTPHIWTKQTLQDFSLYTYIYDFAYNLYINIIYIYILYIYIYIFYIFKISSATLMRLPARAARSRMEFCDFEEGARPLRKLSIKKRPAATCLSQKVFAPAIVQAKTPFRTAFCFVSATPGLIP